MQIDGERRHWATRRWLSTATAVAAMTIAIVMAVTVVQHMRRRSWRWRRRRWLLVGRHGGGGRTVAGLVVEPLLDVRQMERLADGLNVGAEKGIGRTEESVNTAQRWAGGVAETAGADGTAAGAEFDLATNYGWIYRLMGMIRLFCIRGNVIGWFSGEHSRIDFVF